ncbi:MAG: NYN domain-containing protein [Nitrospirae bacterium]|nr:NYN domain-containing protein [Nitrospirota bacterium]
MPKVVFMIDGWFMRKRIYELKSFLYDGKNIRNYCLNLLKPNEEIYRIFYYDTKPLEKRGHNPVTKKAVDFSKTKVAEDQFKLFESIKRTPNFALRLGETVWENNSWAINDSKLKALLSQSITVGDLTEHDVKPIISQKAVDMKMGLDITLIAIKRLADKLIIITGDSDVVPVLKLARQEGMMVGLDCLGKNVRPVLKEHIDFLCKPQNKTIIGFK